VIAKIEAVKEEAHRPESSKEVALEEQKTVASLISIFEANKPGGSSTTKLSWAEASLNDQNVKELLHENKSQAYGEEVATSARIAAAAAEAAKAAEEAAQAAATEVEAKADLELTV
jgi:hypothetical protein